jgi:hypothetical protein
VAETKAKKAAAEDEELVEVFVPRNDAMRNDPGVYVGINDRSWLLPRGRKSMVPRFVAEELERSKRADIIRGMNMQTMLEQANAQ